MRASTIALVAALFSVPALPSVSQTASADLPAAVAVERQQVPGVFQMRLGDYQVTALSDGTVAQDVPVVINNVDPETIHELLSQSFLTNPVEASINAFLIDTGSRLLLVDTGAGQLFGPGNGGKLLASLAAAGFQPEQVDDVLITHVHTDHSGGLTNDGRLVFPNATVHVGQPDLDFFLNAANATTSGIDQRFFDEAEATVGPYVEVGQVEGFSGVTELFPGVTAIPTPGHTPGHAFFRVESQGQSIEFWGDIMHFAAVQFPRPDATVAYDVDSPAAAAQRAVQFAEAASDRQLVAVAHVNFPGIGHIEVDADGTYVWNPVEYRDAGERP